MTLEKALDILIHQTDQVLQILLPPQNKSRMSERQSPAHAIDEAILTSSERKHVAALMRINHAGEICAQALYQGHALTVQSMHLKQHMKEAAQEEIDHLAWCEERLRQLGTKPSYLNPIWHIGSFCLGALAGMTNDAISLGFVAETERQVSVHLYKHLQQVPAHDLKTAAILKQMQQDEDSHAHNALEAGGKELPKTLKSLMHYTSKVMTHISYYF